MCVQSRDPKMNIEIHRHQLEKVANFCSPMPEGAREDKGQKLG